jgi:hypothetical protein
MLEIRRLIYYVCINITDLPAFNKYAFYDLANLSLLFRNWLSMQLI